VTAETVQDIVLWVYNSSLRIENTLYHLISWKDPKSTAKYALSLNLIMLTAWLLGDSLCLMLVFNICILYPLAYKKKKANLETLSRSFDSILDKYLRLIPFLNKKMVAVSEFKKQQ
jgi:hypothetical protein